jgi:hypothetical protein
MIKFWVDYFVSKLAVISLGLFILGIASLLIFGALVAVGVDLGYFVVPFMICVPLAFVTSAVTIILCFFSTKLLSKSFLIVCIAFILSAFPTYVLYCVHLGAKARIAKEKANMGTYNLRILGNSLKEYTKRHDGHLPDANNWCDQLLADKELGLTIENFYHPQKERLGLKGKMQFAFNKNLGGKRLADITGDTVLIFEADGGWNLNGGAELLPTRYREHGYITIFFVDGTDASYWFYEGAVRKFKADRFGRASMYYEQPRWGP